MKDRDDEPGSGRAIDWLAFLKAGAGESKVDLAELGVGDVLFVETENTRYRLEVIEATGRMVRVTSDRGDRPAGEMRLSGCTYGLSSTIAPDHLFCGGNLELGFRTGDGRAGTHTTSEIRKVVLVHREKGHTDARQDP